MGNLSLVESCCDLSLSCFSEIKFHLCVHSVEYTHYVA